MIMARKRSHGSGTLYKRKGSRIWTAEWYDHDGKRRQKSTRTTDKAAAERILAKSVAGAALRREGVINPRQDRYSVEGRKPLSEHVEAYILSCRHAEQAKRNISQKESQLARLIAESGVSRLGDLTSEVLQSYMAQLVDSGRSARTANHVRQNVCAFLNWCVKTGRIESNPTTIVPKLDELRDRRRVRRPLTDDELARLLAVAEPRGRKAWYLCAALAGLRKGDLQRLRWRDINFTDKTITISDGKAKRADILPLHPQLAEVLSKRQVEAMATPMANVFPTTVTDQTRQKDFLRAGLAREETETEIVDGSPQVRSRIVCEDAEGRVIDLHALRTTLGTNLARAGVAPQVAQGIMRHSDYKTTLKHYTVLGLTDTSRAIESLPGIASGPQANQATGTHDSGQGQDCQQYCRQSVDSSKRSGANGCDEVGDSPSPDDDANSSDDTVFCVPLRHDATMCTHTAGVAQLVERQPSKRSPGAENTDKQADSDAPLPTASSTASNPTPDDGLGALIDAWPSLPAVVRAGILAMVEAARG